MFDNILIVLSILLVISSIVFTLYYNHGTKLYPYTTNTMNPEIFCVQFTGQFIVATSNSKLINGYVYATDIEINQALKNGMRIPGVSNGDLAIYLTPGYYDASINPFATLTNAGDFNSSNSVTFTPYSTPKNTTNWVFIKGFKPLVQFAANPYIFFQTLPQIIQYTGVLPWNSTQYNSDAPLTLGQNEVFLTIVHPMPSDYKSASNALNNGYTVATSEQINWSISRGLSYNYNTTDCINITYTDGVVLKPATLAPGIPYTSACSSDNLLAIWGVKPKDPNAIISNLFTKITDFNSKKYSLYN